MQNEWARDDNQNEPPTRREKNIDMLQVEEFFNEKHLEK